MTAHRRLVLPLLACLFLAWVACPCLWSRMLGVASAEGASVEASDNGPAKRCCCCCGSGAATEGDDAPESPCACSRRVGDNATAPDASIDMGSAELVGELTYAVPSLMAAALLQEAAWRLDQAWPDPRPRPADVRRGTVLLR